MIKLDCASQWCAVDTAEITVVGNRNPEVVNRPLVAIGEQAIHKTSGLDEGFLYVTFDIIKERVIEVKEFGACAAGSGQRAAGSRQRAAPRLRAGQAGRKINSNKSKYVKFPY